MRTVIWNIGKTISRSGGRVSLIQSEEESRSEGEKYIEKLKSDGETVISVKEEGSKLIITLE